MDSRRESVVNGGAEVTVSEAYRRCGVSRSVVESWVRSNRLRFRYSLGRILVPAADLPALAAEWRGKKAAAEAARAARVPKGVRRAGLEPGPAEAADPIARLAAAPGYYTPEILAELARRRARFAAIGGDSACAG